MKKYLIILLLFSYGLNAQKLPADFKETIWEEYNSISDEVKKEELRLEFDEYYQLRKDGYISRQKFLTEAATRQSSSNLCDNGTFESGDINVADWLFYWYGGASSGGQAGTNRINTGHFTSGGHPPADQVHHQVQSPGSDNHFPTLNRVYSYPAGNSGALRLGNAHNLYGIESVAKNILVTPANASLKFSYAIVTQNPSGHGNALPFFEVNIIDANNPSVNYNSLVDLGGGSNRIRSDHPLLVPNNTSAQIRHKEWECINVDMSSIIGTQIIIEFRNRDCWAGGHWAYAYIDNLCLSCDDAPTNGGSVKLNLSRTDTCSIPGQICVDYTLPTGNGATGDFTLELIQNGTVLNTLSSPTLTSGINYCFNLNASNTALLNTSLSGFDYNVIGNFAIGSFPLSPKILGNSSQGIKSGINNDYDFECKSSGVYCCDGENLIKNGNFEAGNVGFQSDYTATISVNPGEYAVIDDNDAGLICNQWNVEDHTHCSTGNNDNILVVNGQTQQSTNTNNVIWQTAVPIRVERDSQYKFCAYMKHLPQCCFDITPSVRIEVRQNNSVWMPILNWTPITYIGTTPPPCDWREISGVFVAQNTAEIRILIDETGNGDGNDLAIDDISLTKKPRQSVIFSLNDQPKSGTNFYELTASINGQTNTDDNLPDTDCKYLWVVAEVSDLNNPLSSIIFSTLGLGGTHPWGTSNPTWGLTTDFPNYNGGTIKGNFEYKKGYIALLIVTDCMCEGDNYSYQVIYNHGSNRSSDASELEIRRFEADELSKEEMKKLMRQIEKFANGKTSKDKTELSPIKLNPR